MKKIVENDETIGEAERRYREFVEDPVARRAALERDIWIRDRGQMIRDAREEGVEQGIVQGTEQGIAQGIELGREEQARSAAMRLIESGIDDEVIRRATGLSAEELSYLRSTQ